MQPYIVVYCLCDVLIVILLTSDIIYREGSVIVQYEVIVPILNTSITYIALLDNNLKNAAINWTNYKQNFSGTVDIERTRAIKSESLSNVTCLNLFIWFMLIFITLHNSARIRWLFGNYSDIYSYSLSKTDIVSLEC